MKKVFIFIAVLLLGLFLPFSIFAQQSSQSVELPKNEVINHDYFATGNTVDIEGTVNGDVYAAGGTVLINGNVNGDVLAAGGQITVKGNVRNVRVAGGQILLDGKINGNATAVGGNIATSDTSTISGSLVGAGGQFTVLGPVGKTISLATGQASIGNTVGGDVWINTQSLTLTSQAKVNGNISYVSSQKALIENGASVSGTVSQTYPPQGERQKQQAPAAIFAAWAGLHVALSILSFLVNIVVGLLLISFMPIYVGRVAEHLTRHPWQSLLIGLVTWILTPFILFFLVLTLIGIPFAVLFGIGVTIFSYIGEIIASLVIGGWTVGRFSKRKNSIVDLLVGLVLVGIIGLIPILGWLFTFVLSAIGFGGVLYMEKVYYVELKTKKII